ncbi:hypothetical protein [Ruegeria arenilitoris]|uniref:hypothetical protein n=1 Tax=Ruegeria arenilitoris TaxID=1173585 RepID=UPI00147F47FD|nr:hypothetical protein [Ruegeria arenilitoris]
MSIVQPGIDLLNTSDRGLQEDSHSPKEHRIMCLLLRQEEHKPQSSSFVFRQVNPDSADGNCAAHKLDNCPLLKAIATLFWTRRQISNHPEVLSLICNAHKAVV